MDDSSTRGRVAQVAEAIRPAVVPAQMTCMAALVLPGGPGVRLPVPLRVLGGLLAASGAVLAAGGAGALGRELTVSVDPRAGAGLRTDGAYRFSRNPIYAGLLLGAVGLSLMRGRAHVIAAAAGLAAVLHLKVGLEEARLRERFGAEYDAYAAHTPRLLGLPDVRRH